MLASITDQKEEGCRTPRPNGAVRLAREQGWCFPEPLAALNSSFTWSPRRLRSPSPGSRQAGSWYRRQQRSPGVPKPTPPRGQTPRGRVVSPAVPGSPPRPVRPDPLRRTTAEARPQDRHGSEGGDGTTGTTRPSKGPLTEPGAVQPAVLALQ